MEMILLGGIGKDQNLGGVATDLKILKGAGECELEVIINYFIQYIKAYQIGEVLLQIFRGKLKVKINSNEAALHQHRHRLGQATTVVQESEQSACFAGLGQG